MQLLNGIQKTQYFSIPFVVPIEPKNAGGNHDAIWTKDLIAAIDVAMSHPVPLSVDFEKGFTGSLANLEPIQIISLLYTDITTFRIAIKALGNVQKDDEKELLKVFAWRGYLQSLYATWLSFSCGITLKLSETKSGMTKLEVATNPKDKSFEPAFLRIAKDGDDFTDILTKYGEVVDPVGSIGATINNALQTLALIEQSCFFSFTHCTDSDPDGAKDYFLSMAKGAFVVRAMAMNWMLKGVGGFTKTKPLNSKMKVNLKSIDKESLKELQNSVLMSLWNLSLGLTMFQFVAKAQRLFAPNCEAFSCYSNFDMEI